MLILDTYHQLAEWAKKGCRQKIGIRVNLDYITVDDRFRNKKSRFGISFNDQKVIDLLNNVELKNVICLHCHLSGNNREPSIYRDVLIQLQNIRKTHRLNNVILFDIGGGYKIGDARKSLEFLDYVNEINEVCPKDIQIIYEPGNSIVRNCAEYHTKIISVKNTGGECIFVADGSSLHIPKINYMQNDFHFETIGKKTRYSGSRIYGNTCKESDLLMKLDSNIELGVGDYLVLENVGAYSMNEISPLILGVPNTITNMKEKIILGDHIFCYVCKYSDCYNKNGRNNYSILKDNTSQKGLYAFVKNGNIIYIGVAYSQSIEKRVKQHFRNDSGGLRNKLSSQDIKDLEKSALYICQLGESKQNLLFEEAYLIGLYKPKLNYL